MTQNADLLVIQTDADVADEEEIGRSAPCPPAKHGADAIRELLLEWLSLSELPPKVVLCVPSMASETWAMVALFPNEWSSSIGSRPAECHTGVKGLLRKLGRRHVPKLVVSQNGKLKNQAAGYKAQREGIETGWSGVIASCSQAARFDEELRAVLPERQA